MMRHRLLILTMLPTMFLLLFVSTITSQSQEENIHLRLYPPDTSQFPEITFNLIALDQDFQVISSPVGLRISEDGNPIGKLLSETVKVGSEVVFVVDANRDIEQRDEPGGPSRREKVRDSIVRYVDRNMDPTNKDRISIIVPDGDKGQFLDEPGMVFQNAVKNAINFYVPFELRETPLNEMLMMAIRQAERGIESGRVPAVVLFSDSGDLNEQLDFDSLVTEASDSQIPLYTAILGTRADPWEIEDVERLTIPTGGSYVHMPEPGDADPLYGLIENRSTMTQITYRSGLNTSGQHTISAALDGGGSNVAFEIVVAPPTIGLSVDNSSAIQRAAQEPDIPLVEIEPRYQEMVAEVSWPDGQPRELSAVSILVNGEDQPVRTPVMDANGILTFDWDISKLDEEVYVVQVQVEDELGLKGVSEPLPMAIEVIRPVIQATITPVPSPSATRSVEPTATPEPSSLLDLARDNIVYIGGGALLVLLFAVVLLIVMGMIRALRKKPETGQGIEEDSSKSGEATAKGPGDADYTYAMMPDFAMSQYGAAYLEALDNAPEHATLIPLTGSNIALGRDPKSTQIQFSDRSVSRLHARILESGGSYRIYDEGSTSGTFVNFERIGLAPRILENKDEIHLGRVHLRFHLASPGRKEDGDEGILDAQTRPKG